MPIPRERLRLSPEELDELCSSAHELHAATVSPDGMPHVVPLWFVWIGGEIWINNLRRSRRSRDIGAGSSVALCVDTGELYTELRGAVFYGELVEAADHDRLAEARAAFAAKYWGGTDVTGMKSHVWLRLERARSVSWDFRKIPAGRDPRADATGAAGNA